MGSSPFPVCFRISISFLRSRRLFRESDLLCIIRAAGRNGPAGSVKLYSEAAFHKSYGGLPGMDAVFSFEVMARSGNDLQGAADEK